MRLRRAYSAEAAVVVSAAKAGSRNEALAGLVTRAGAKLPQRHPVTVSAGESCAFAFVTVRQENP
jgi:hypothetical protein